MSLRISPFDAQSPRSSRSPLHGEYVGNFSINKANSDTQQHAGIEGFYTERQGHGMDSKSAEDFKVSCFATVWLH